MILNLKCLVKAATELNIDYQLVGETENLVMIKNYIFLLCSTPLITHSEGLLMKDKDYIYQLFKNSVPTPKTKAYLDPLSKKKYQKFVKFNSKKEIAKDIELNFNYPFIVKRNFGSRSNNVFKVHNYKELLNSIKLIYKKNSYYYDYVLIAQELVEAKAEVRAVVLNNKLKFAYYKFSKFVKNHEQLYMQLNDKEMLKELENHIKHITTIMNLGFVAVDFLLLPNNDFVFLEINASPALGAFIVRYEDTSISLFKEILECLQL